MASTPKTVYRNSQVSIALPSIRDGEATNTNQQDPVAPNGSTLIGIAKESVDAGQNENGWDNDDLAATILGLKIRSVWGEARAPLPARL